MPVVPCRFSLRSQAATLGVTMTTALETKFEYDRAIPLTPGGFRGICLRVFYRLPPARRWERFLLIPNENETLEELEQRVYEAALLHFERFNAHG